MNKTERQREDWKQNKVKQNQKRERKKKEIKRCYFSCFGEYLSSEWTMFEWQALLLTQGSYMHWPFKANAKVFVIFTIWDLPKNMICKVDIYRLQKQ